jgi:hypothetical protein
MRHIRGNDDLETFVVMGISALKEIKGIEFGKYGNENN